MKKNKPKIKIETIFVNNPVTVMMVVGVLYVTIVIGVALFAGDCS